MTHPVIALERRYSRDGAVGAVVVVVGAVVLALPEGSVLTLLAIVGGFALLASAAAVAEDDEDDADKWGDDALAEDRRLYSTGQITHSEFERRVEVLVDDRAQRIHEVAEGIHGVGPDTASAFALAFSNVDEFEAASREDLEEIHDVGPSTSAAVVDYFAGER